MASAKKVYLLDGHSLIYKAFHAMGGLSNREGFPTGAIYGFLQIFFRLMEQQKPEYVAVVFDPKGPSFRKEMYDLYKANRPPQPDEIRQQFPVLKEVLTELQIPMYTIEKFEADDVLASIARWSVENGGEACIVSVDKDLYQCVNEKITILRDHLGKIELLDEAGVRDKMGVRPDQVPAYLGLLGDSSDNIPGVPGIGKKRASELLVEFDNIPAILAEAKGKTKPKFWANLDEFSEQALLSEQLATIRHDVYPDGLTWNDLSWSMPAPSPRYRELLETLNFRSYIDALGGQTIEDRETDYKTVLTADDLKNVSDALQQVDRAAIDTETTGLDPFTCDLVGISLSWKENQAVYIPIAVSGDQQYLDLNQVRESLRPHFESKKIQWVAHHWGFDYRILKQNGFPVGPISFDTMLAAYVVNPDRPSKGLKALALECLGIEMTKIDTLVSDPDDFLQMAEVDTQKISDYACQDADLTLQLFHHFAPQLRDAELEELFNRIEMPLVTVLADMELKGVSIDEAYFRELLRTTKEKLNALKVEIHEIAGTNFNINSPKQLAKIFFEDLNLPIIKKTATGPSTDVSVLEALSKQHPLPDRILVYRQLEKLRGTYIESLPMLINSKTGRIHTSYNQTIAATGRLSSSEPNLQNIPIRTQEGREIRRGFIPSQKGWKFFAADYSQIELRILTHISKDPALVEAFKSGDDIHTLTAAKVFKIDPNEITKEQRGQAKAVNFGIIYGMSAFRLSNDQNISRQQAQQFIDEYFAVYKGVRSYIDDTIAYCSEHGYVKTLMGRRRYIPDINAGNRNKQSQAERIAMNTPIQGTSADMIKIAMIAVDQKLQESGLSSRMLMQVHDELIFEAPEEELEELQKIVECEMKNALPLDVPIVVESEIGNNWEEV